MVVDSATRLDAGWASMKNGSLLRAANGTFDVLVTADRNMHYQQNRIGLSISALVFPGNRARLVKSGVFAIVQSLLRVRPNEKVVMDLTAAADWSSVTLDDVLVEEGLARHVFR